MRKDLPRCITVTQGNSPRAPIYRDIVREFEQAFRENALGTERGHFEELSLLFLPEARAVILRAAEHDGVLHEIPPPGEFVRRLSENDPELTKQVQDLLRTSTACDLMQQAQWILNGRRVYDLSPSLFANFIETDFSRLKGEDIPVPLNSFYIHLPDAKRLGIERDGCVFDGVYVRHARNAQDELFLDILVILVNPEDEMDELFIAMPVPLQGDVEERIEQERAHLDPDATKFSDQFIRLVIGLCFYLSCDDADVERKHFGPSPEVKARAKKLGGTAGKKLLAINTLPVHYLRVGHRHETRSVELESLAGADKETRKLLKRHVVRGHFRQQPCGPGRKERKTVFVRSFWKGPPWAEAVGSIHKIRERAAS
jgi:hypothetical protein